MTRLIRFNAFDVAHQSPYLRRRPEDQSARYEDLTYWADLAKLLEGGRFDGLFIADVLGTYDVYGAGDEAAIRQAGFEHPHPFAPFARRVATPDHLTKGRVGWNVVTGCLPAPSPPDRSSTSSSTSFRCSPRVAPISRMCTGNVAQQAVRAWGSTSRGASRVDAPGRGSGVDHHRTAIYFALIILVGRFAADLLSIGSST